MTGRLEGKVAIVTGGGRNIGRAIAVGFAKEGAAVSICGRRQELLDETLERIRTAGGRGLALRADVTRLSEVERLVERTRAAFGGLDAVVANAGGGGGYEAIDAIDPSWWEHVLRINVLGTFHTARAALPALRERGGGAIVTLSGGGAYFPLLGMNATAYATAKAAVCRFTDQLAVELLEEGIRVNCLQPGLVWDEERLAEVAEEERRTGRPHPDRGANHPPEDAAELATWLVSEESSPLTGRLVSVDDDWWRERTQVERVCASLHAYGLRRVSLEGGPG